jgi:hypothetical protein
MPAKRPPPLGRWRLFYVPCELSKHVGEPVKFSVSAARLQLRFSRQRVRARDDMHVFHKAAHHNELRVTLFLLMTSEISFTVAAQNARLSRIFVMLLMLTSMHRRQKAHPCDVADFVVIQVARAPNGQGSTGQLNVRSGSAPVTIRRYAYVGGCDD